MNCFTIKEQSVKHMFKSYELQVSICSRFLTKVNKLVLFLGHTLFHIHIKSRTNSGTVSRPLIRKSAKEVLIRSLGIWL